MWLLLILFGILLQTSNIFFLVLVVLSNNCYKIEGQARMVFLDLVVV
jgi:hypothetical protein